MLIIKSKKMRAFLSKDSQTTDAIEAVDEQWLRQRVEEISIPRNYSAEPENNRKIADWVESQFTAIGYHVFRQGPYDNLVAVPMEFAGERSDEFSPRVLVGAHYDTKPGTPGADDNGSAVAAMLAAARAVMDFSSQETRSRCVFVAFNREEDGLLGSYDFVDNFLPSSWSLAEVHILEMVGYCDHAPGSQGLPTGLPIKLAHDQGNFLALIANRHSNWLLKPILRSSRTYLPDFPVWGLKVFLGLEKKFSDLRRSDHAPFWDKKIPAFMWTDTSEFRNHNYHQPSDTPDTLNYGFLKNVTQVLVAHVLRIA